MSVIKLALAGNPNCGKTTLFNALTGEKQRVGNWAGVTVERKSGEFTHAQQAYEVVDIPGVYSLVVSDLDTAIDEKIACDYLLSRDADIIVNVIDATNLERNLYLTAQLLDMQLPVVVVLNMMDMCSQQHVHIDIHELSQKLGCPVLPMVAKLGQGVPGLLKLLARLSHSHHVHVAPLALQYHAVLRDAVNELAAHIQHTHADLIALRLLEDDQFSKQFCTPETLILVQQYQLRISADCQEDADMLIADARYGFIHQVCEDVVKRGHATARSLTETIDKVVLNRFLGIPIFLAMMYAMFLFAINLGGVFQDFFDGVSQTLFVSGLGYWLHHVGVPDGIVALLASGVGKGINTTVTFIPIISAMFFFLALLESCGYMARAAFVVDRLMRALGLPGKSFVPMIVGFGCNVPAVLAARTLENHRDRVLTILMTPFMSCGARLAIFAVFTAAFFPVGGQNIVFALYLIGIVMAVLTGFLLRKTVFRGEPATLVMELPPYHIPSLQSLLSQTWSRLKYFLLRAGKVIVPVCMLLGALNSIDIHGHYLADEANQYSLLAYLGRALTPLFAPMGITHDNWPATVGLLTGTLAKEVVIGTLNTLYLQVGHLAQHVHENFALWPQLKSAALTIPQNLRQLPSELGNPVLASAPDSEMSQPVYGVMYRFFGGQLAAFSYLIFITLYVPCVSTVAVIARELNTRWAVFSLVWSTFLAYMVAVIFYQLATASAHEFSSSCWVIGLLAVFFSVVLLMPSQRRLA